MELTVWAKTFLTIYKYLESIADSIDKLIMNKSLSDCPEGTLRSVNDILDLSERKITLINLKILIDSALANINIKQSKVLILKYFDGVSCEAAAALENNSMRTYFRHINSAIDEFSNALDNMGCDTEYIKRTFKKETWLFNLYERLNKQEEVRTVKPCKKAEENNMSGNILKLLSKAYGGCH